MARPLRIQYPGAVYKVTHRGFNYQAIFRDDNDHLEFLNILAETINTYGIILHGYALLDNEFNLLIETPLGNLSESLRYLNISYTTRFNRRHNRTGNLLHGRFKSLLIDKTANLSRLSRSVHLIPAQLPIINMKPLAERRNYLLGYQWSSLPGFLKLNKRQIFMEYADVLADFGGDTVSGREAYKKQVIQDVSTGISIEDKITDQSILGNEEFVSWVRNRYMLGSEERAAAACGRIHQHKPSDEILKIVAEEVGSSQADLLHRSGLGRALTMDMLYRFGGMKNPEIGELMAIDFSTVSQARKRLRIRAVDDQAVKSLISRIERRLHL